MHRVRERAIQTIGNTFIERDALFFVREVTEDFRSEKTKLNSELKRRQTSSDSEMTVPRQEGTLEVPAASSMEV